MAKEIVSSCRRKYILGRWHPVKERCEYLAYNGRWGENIDDARSWNEPLCKKLGQYGSNHMPVFIQKVFVTRRRRSWSYNNNTVNSKTVKPCKLNHWQLLEGVMQI